MTSTQTLGTFEKPRTHSATALHCARVGCDGELFSAFFDAEGEAHPDDRSGAKWLSICTSCGDFHAPRRATRRGR